MRSKRSAFTLLELLVVVAIIMLLALIVVVALGGVRGAASRTDSMSTLRQMSLGYSSYSSDHRMKLMPGYLNSLDFFTLGIRFSTLADGEEVIGVSGDMADSGSYVWRLAPYLDHNWMTFFDELDLGVRSRVQSDFGDPANRHLGPGTMGEIGAETNDPAAHGLSQRPAFGLNSIFIGGDSFHGGELADHHPWNTNGLEPVAVTRQSEVRNPQKVILFGSAAMAAANDETYENSSLGYCELRAPFTILENDVWVKNQWLLSGAGSVVKGAGFDGPAGLPIDRTGGKILPVCHLDGSAEVIPLLDIWNDMTFWSPRPATYRPTSP